MPTFDLALLNDGAFVEKLELMAMIHQDLGHVQVAEFLGEAARRLSSGLPHGGSVKIENCSSPADLGQRVHETCSASLRKAGEPYPRTCPACGFGACVYGLTK